MTSRSLLLPLLLSGAVACGTDAAPGTSGALGQSSTSTACAPDDAACETSGLDAPVAVGARLPLDVRITALGVAAPLMTLETARPDVLDVEGLTLVGKTPGFASVMMMNETGLVLDFVTMSVATADRIELYRLTDSGALEAAPVPSKIQVAPGDDFELMVKMWTGAARLLGEVETTWSLDADIATILDAGRPGSRRLRVKTPGTAKLTVTGAELTRTLDVEVLP